MLTNEEILKIAMEQSALDFSCTPGDFLKDENVIVTARKNKLAKSYLQLDSPCLMISYGNNIIASVPKEYAELVQLYMDRFWMPSCFETPAIIKLNELFHPYHMQACFMAENFLPDVTKLQEISCPYEIRVLDAAELRLLSIADWSDALTGDDTDILGVGAYDQDRLIGLAACGSVCETMYQMGVDVLPDYSRQRIASCLISRLALEVLKKGKVPFYSCAWSNIRSVRTALACGFYPAWVELTVMPESYIHNLMN